MSYFSLFNVLRCAFNQKLDENLEPDKAPSAFWPVQTWLPTGVSPSPAGRVLLKDIFYVLDFSVLSGTLKQPTDARVPKIGMVRQANIDRVSRPGVKRAMQLL